MQVLINLFKAAVRRALKTRGARKLKDLLNKTKSGDKSLSWFWKQIDDVADWMIGIAVDEIIDELAQEIVDNNPGISYSVAKDYVKANYRNSIKGVISNYVLGGFNELKEEFNECSAREAAQGCYDNWDGLYVELREAAEEAARRTYETWSGRLFSFGCGVSTTE